MLMTVPKLFFYYFFMRNHHFLREINGVEQIVWPRPPRDGYGILVRARAVRNVLGNLYLRLRVPTYQCNNGNYLHPAHANSYPAQHKVGYGLEPIQTRLLLERGTSCRGVATCTHEPLPHACIYSERMRQTALVVCRIAPSASGRG